MSLSVHNLSGCSPAPLAHYLKAIGILRVVAQQADADARGWWADDAFCLTTSLDRGTLEAFFLHRFQPTPLMSPWNKGAGFFKPDDPGLVPIERSTAPRFAQYRRGIQDARELLGEISDADSVIRAVKARTKTDSSFQTREQRKLLRESETFTSLTSALRRIVSDSGTSARDRELTSREIAILDELVGDTDRRPTRKEADQLKASDGYKQLLTMAEARFKTLKAKLIPECYRRWRGPHADWIAAALVLGSDGEPSCPSLLGTGGNDGNLDFTNNAMLQLGVLFDVEQTDAPPSIDAASQLRAAMWADFAPCMQSGAVGQFLPGGAGGANSSVGFGGGALVNPWDFVLMLEGAVAFASGVVRRMTTGSLPQAAAPFAVYSSPAGFASGVDGEKSRGEQWMPLWEKPMTYREFEALVTEGRCQIGARPAQRPLDMARAIARLGVARGISAFERYGYIERNGQSNLATPLGRWQVPDSQPPFQELLDEIEGWVERLRQKGGGKGAPAAIGRAARRCENAMMNCCREGHSPARWRELLIRLGEAEAQLVRSPGFTASAGLQPLGAYRRWLDPQWLLAAAADSPELRLALALAGAHGTRERASASAAEYRFVWDRAYPVRRHFLPLEHPRDQAPVTWRPRLFAAAGERLASDPSVVCTTGAFERDTVALVRRRVVEAHHSLRDFLPLAPVPGTEASLADVHEFLSGRLNGAEILALARPLMALDWAGFEKHRLAIRKHLRFAAARREQVAADALGVYGLFRLCHHWRPFPVPASQSSDERPERDDPSYVEHEVRLAPSIYMRLAHGDLAAAVKLAVRRLNASGLRPHVTLAVGDQAYARRLAAALVFPLGNENASRLARRLLRPHFAPSDPEPSEESGVPIGASEQQ